MFSLVLPHVDGGVAHPGGVQSGLDDGVGVPHEGEDSSVGGVAGVDIQKTGTGGGSDSICYGLYHLVESRSRLGRDVTICQTFKSLPSEKLGTHSIILDISPAVKEQQVSPLSVGGLVLLFRTGLKEGSEWNVVAHHHGIFHTLLFYSNTNNI